MMYVVAFFLVVFVAWFVASYIYPLLIFVGLTLYALYILDKNEPAKSDNERISSNDLLKSVIFGVIGALAVVVVLTVLKMVFIWLYNAVPIFNNSSLLTAMVYQLANPMRMRLWFALIMTVVSGYFVVYPQKFKDFCNWMTGTNKR